MAKVNFDPEVELGKLTAIREQVETASAQSSETRSLSKKLDVMTAVLSDNAALLAEARGKTEADVFALAEEIAAYQESVAPKTATVLWNSDEVKKTIKALDAFEGLGLLSEGQVVQLTSLKASFGSGSTRAPSTPADTIANRPPKVFIIKPAYAEDGKTIDLGASETFGRLAGNTANAYMNIAARLATVTETDKSTEDYNTLKAFARKVCEQGVNVQVGELLLVPVEPTEDGRNIFWTAE